MSALAMKVALDHEASARFAKSTGLRREAVAVAVILAAGAWSRVDPRTINPGGLAWGSDFGRWDWGWIPGEGARIDRQEERRERER